jgi:hypothetical protein
MIHFSSVAGGDGGNIPGLVDSGADTTSLPMDYAKLMGYTSAQLDHGTVTMADGSSVSVWVANVPVTAYVVGLPELPFEVCPTFVPGADHALWGRTDFFKAFEGVAFEEAGQRFALTVP